MLGVCEVTLLTSAMSRVQSTRSGSMFLHLGQVW